MNTKRMPEAGLFDGKDLELIEGQAIEISPVILNRTTAGGIETQ